MLFKFINCSFFVTIRFPFFSRLEMLTSLYNWRVAVKDRATRCSRDTILKNPWVPFLALVAILAVAATSVSASKEVATNSFYVKIHGDPDQPDLAHKIARRNGFHNLGPVSFFPSYVILIFRWKYVVCVVYINKITYILTLVYLINVRHVFFFFEKFQQDSNSKIIHLLIFKL